MHYDLSLRKSVDAVNNIMDIGFEASMNVHKARYGKELNFYVLELKIYLGLHLNATHVVLKRWKSGTSMFLLYKTLNKVAGTCIVTIPLSVS